VRFTERRIALRVEPRLPACFRCDMVRCQCAAAGAIDEPRAEGPWLSGTVLNASAAGVLIALTGSRAPEAGSQGEVRIMVSDPLQPFAPPRYLAARAVVRRVLCSTIGGRIRIALEFRNHLKLVTEEGRLEWSGLGALGGTIDCRGF